MPERSAEERERARAEREARRSSRAEGSAPATPEPEPPPDDGATQAWSPVEPAHEEENGAVSDFDRFDPPGVGIEARRGPVEPVEEPAPAHFDRDERYEPEEPLPPLPSRRERRRAGRGAAPPPRKRSELKRRTRGRWRRRLGALLALAAIGGALYFINEVFQPFQPDGRGVARVAVPAGADVREIGDLLDEEGVVESGAAFNLNATLTLRRGDLKPGRYTLPMGMSNGDAIDALVQGPEAKVIRTFTLTIPEGLSRRETDEVVEDSEVDGDYLRASGQPEVLRRARRYGLPRRTRTAEGFFFPATYRLPIGAPASELLDQQLDAFRDNFGELNLSSARRRNLSRYDVLIVASMVEREAALARERPLIAAVIYNRLRRGIPLGIDATIRYAENNWTRPLRQSELEREGPYNTRLRRGLPPTPIGNPGLSSMRAAARPASVRYLYYVRKPGKSGAHAFSTNEAKFLRDVERYQASRGG